MGNFYCNAQQNNSDKCTYTYVQFGIRVCNILVNHFCFTIFIFYSCYGNLSTLEDLGILDEVELNLQFAFVDALSFVNCRYPDHIWVSNFNLKFA
jgi:hypothetical protein